MHLRSRHIKNVLLKRAKIFSVLGVLGPRQVGKSTFLKNEWCKQKNASYLTFDKQEIAARAKHAPEQLLLAESDNQQKHLIIDEAQKVSTIFDSIKALIDENRRMGAFTLSGSVEFSLKSGVRESLAGRMGITRLFPLTLRELNNQAFISPWATLNFDQVTPLSPKNVETWLNRGGMPIFCQFTDIDERITAINSWLEAICYRDLKQFKDAKYDGELADHLLRIIATTPMISINELSHDLGFSRAAITQHLSALESLFLIYKIPSFENPRAQPVYRIFDAGVLNAISNQGILSSRHNCLMSLLTNEIYAQYEYAGKLKPYLYYYRTRGGAEIDLVLKTRDQLVGIECSLNVDISPYQQRGMNSFLEKYKNAVGYFVAPIQKAYKLKENLHVIPWNVIG